MAKIDQKFDSFRPGLERSKSADETNAVPIYFIDHLWIFDL